MSNNENEYVASSTSDEYYKSLKCKKYEINEAELESIKEAHEYILIILSGKSFSNVQLGYYAGILGMIYKRLKNEDS